MRSILVKGADRIELTIRSYTDRTGKTPKKKTFLQVHRYIEKDDKWTNKDFPCKSEAEALLKMREVNQYWIEFHGYTVTHERNEEP